MKDKTAIPHKHDRDMVLTADRGSMSRVKARQLGYRISDDAGTPEGASGTLASWQRTIESLREARVRPSAAAQLIEEQPLMSIDRVRAFLRGLPIEHQRSRGVEAGEIGAERLAVGIRKAMGQADPDDCRDDVKGQQNQAVGPYALRRQPRATLKLSPEGRHWPVTAG